MYFQELFIWLAREHQLSQLIDAPGGSCWLVGALWAPMVPLGGSWRKYMRTIVLFCKTYTFHSQGYSERLPRPIFWIIPNDHSTSGSKARKPPNQASWGWFWWFLEPRLESHGTILYQKTFCDRIIVHWVRVLCLLLTQPARDPRKRCVYAKVFPWSYLELSPYVGCDL